ncbi:unnamed protein product, partial [Musa acuminata subsp. burmannicoides]
GGGRAPGRRSAPRVISSTGRRRPRAGESRKWEDCELPCYITSFLVIVNAKPDLTLETWAHQKARICLG